MTTSTAPSASSVETVRIESSLNASSSTSTMNIESQMEQVQEEISEDYFSEDQTKVLALMNYRKGFNAYLVSYLPDNNQWYDPKVIYAGNRNQDNNRALRTLFFSNNSSSSSSSLRNKCDSRISSNKLSFNIVSPSVALKLLSCIIYL